MIKQQFTQGRPNFAKLEEEVLSFWDESDAFKKSVENRPASDTFIFYDGPPFANGLPHYGHLLGSTAKDVIPRYQTMKGKRVERVWGWDCHGVPVENGIEKELGIKGGKKGIEELGIDKFNDACRASIMAYDKEWQKTIHRLGRWVDFKNAYKTMDTTYMESVWWGFKQLFDKGLVYQGRKVILYCPRCSTPLSNFEIAMDNSYQDTQDWSLYVKFQVKDAKNEYFVAWTTTPWTLPGNVALAVKPEADYVLLEHLTEKNGKEFYWVAKERAAHIAKLLGAKKPTIVKTVKGKELVDTEYEPLYNYMPLDGKKAHYVTQADFVSLEDGTGVVHTAAIFGEDDYKLAQDMDLPRVPTLDDQGKFLEFVTPLAGQFYKKSEEWVVTDLTQRSLALHVEKFTHSYPFCYRCGTPLYFNAMPAWFIDIQALKPELIKSNEYINWYPEHLKYGRFGKGLETAPDWNISRSRYWGTPMPIWEGQGKRRVIGSIAELKHWAVDAESVAHVNDLHREHLDPIEIWVDDEKTIKGKRIFEVFDCWVESASMPFAQVHYPFENKQKFDASYPAQYITEYIAQTRAWFYCMHVISVGIFGSHAFENCLTTGTLQAEDGQKMSKSKKNYPDPMVIIDKYGSDALRLYLMSSTIMKAENVNFSEKSVHEIQNKVINVLWNVYGFYALYVQHETHAPKGRGKIATANYQLKTLHVMDRWVLSKASNTVKDVTSALDTYDVVTASRLLMEFTNDFSTWYLRLSRERLKSGEHEESEHVFARVIVMLCKLFAPFIPFVTETIFQNISDSGVSLHLTDWPVFEDLKVFVDPKLESEMKLVQTIVEQALAIRKKENIKVRQPLQNISVFSGEEKPDKAMLDVVKQEVNIKDVLWNKVSADECNGDEYANNVCVTMDLKLSPELIAEGKMREAIRTIQDLRKKEQVDVDRHVDAWLPAWPTEWESEIKKKTLVKDLHIGEAKIELS